MGEPKLVCLSYCDFPKQGAFQSSAQLLSASGFPRESSFWKGAGR